MGIATAKGAEYRRRAAACLQLAAAAKDTHDKAELLEMARVWHKLADDDLRDEPEPLDRPAMPKNQQQQQQRTPRNKNQT
jgi:hypothetical protein